MIDSGSIVLGWLTRLTLVIGVLGVLAFDVIAVGAGSFGAADDAAAAASAGATVYRDTKDVQKAYTAAVAEAAIDGGTIRPEEFVVGEGTITLTVRKDADTTWMHKAGPLERFTHVKGEASVTLVR